MIEYNNSLFEMAVCQMMVALAGEGRVFRTYNPHRLLFSRRFFCYPYCYSLWHFMMSCQKCHFMPLMSLKWHNILWSNSTWVSKEPRKSTCDVRHLKQQIILILNLKKKGKHQKSQFFLCNFVQCVCNFEIQSGDLNHKPKFDKFGFLEFHNM